MGPCEKHVILIEIKGMTGEITMEITIPEARERPLSRAASEISPALKQSRGT
jgi:hypothetical protein